MYSRIGRIAASRPWTICGCWLGLGFVLALLAPAWDSTTQDDDIRFLPQRCPSVRGYRLLEQAFPQDVFASRLVFAIERESAALTTADLALVKQLVDDLEALRKEAPELKIGKIVSCHDGILGSRLTSEDKQCTLIQVPLGSPFLALQTRAAVDRAHSRLQKRMATAGPDAPKLYATGSAGVGRDLTAATGESLDATTVATVLLVIVVLLLVYRAPLLALVPLVTIAVSVWVALNFLALATLLPGVHLVNISKIFAIVILYGAGTDYCLFLISRYREELHNGRPTPDALCRSVKTVGGALTASAGTVMIGLGMMGLAEFAKVRYAGPAIALSLGVALVASLTLTPALLRLLGPAVFWPMYQLPATRLRHTLWGRGLLALDQWLRDVARRVMDKLARVRPAGRLNRLSSLVGQAFWTRVSHQVAARPVLVWTIAVLSLLPLAVLGMFVSPDYRATGELAPTSDSLRGMTVIQRHFTAGETGPLTVLLVANVDWTSCEGQTQLTYLSRGFMRIDGVAEVRSLTQPLGTPLPGLSFPPAGTPGMNNLLGQGQQGLFGMFDQVRRATHEHYLAEIPAVGSGQWVVGSEEASLGSILPSTHHPLPATHYPPPTTHYTHSSLYPPRRYVTRLDVVFSTDPFDAASIATMKRIQTWLREVLPHASLVGDLQAEVYGVTASAEDLAAVTEADRTRVNFFVLLGIFVILVGLVRKPSLAVYLLATVLLSYFATLGATMLAGTLWTGRPLAHVDWRVPFFLFTILVAVGEDYNILLITRAIQERKRWGAVEGMRRALACTGGTITSCGLIMAGTFATLMLASLGTLKQIGFALAFGVLIDTFVVRPFLVPAFAMRFWRDEPQPKETVELTRPPLAA
jgi:RND superfamily putative drug exporter